LLRRWFALACPRAYLLQALRTAGSVRLASTRWPHVAFGGGIPPFGKRAKKMSKRIVDSFWSVALATFSAAVGMLAINHCSGSFALGSSTPLREGSLLQSLDIGWDGARGTLVFVLAKDCRLSSENSSFYPRLETALARRDDLRVVAILPQGSDQVACQVGPQGVAAEQVQIADLESIGIPETPALILADARGIVRKLWVGKLAAHEEDEVLAALKIR
jgi:hypothetical protein